MLGAENNVEKDVRKSLSHGLTPRRGWNRNPMLPHLPQGSRPGLCHHAPAGLDMALRRGAGGEVTSARAYIRSSAGTLFGS